MKQLSEFIPIILFFIAYKFYDIYVATGVVIVATSIQVAYTWFKYKKVETMQWVTLGLILVMGGATIYLQNEQFIKWNLQLPDRIWRKLNLSWSLFFISVGCINLYVMHHYNTDQWVNFKTFGVPGLMVVFIVAQLAFLYKYIPEQED
jgi:intracellular septation protein